MAVGRDAGAGARTGRSRRADAVAAVGAATPVGRDRFIDLLRVASLVAVMVGHFLMTGVLVPSDAADPLHAARLDNSLVWIPELVLLTWVLQVMPVFFAVGGFSHAVALQSVERRGGGYADFVAGRADRLLRPTSAFAVAVLAFAVMLALMGLDGGRTDQLLRLVGQPVWFVGMYLGVILCAPAMLRLHRRHGILVLAALVGGAVAVDAARLALGAPSWLGWLNVPLVWLAIHQTGYFYADGVPQRLGTPFALALALGGVVTMSLLVVLGPYPTSMVSLGGQPLSNLMPPTVVMLAHTAWLVGLALLLRPVLLRWLEQPRVWAGTVAVSSVSMTAFLWHISAIMLVFGAALRLGLVTLFPEPGTLAWWLTRPLLAVPVLAVLTVLVMAFRRFERPRPWVVPAVDVRRRGRDVLALLSVGVSLTGLAGVAVGGFAGALRGQVERLGVVVVTPVASVLLLVLGTVGVRWAAGPTEDPDRDPAGGPEPDAAAA